jgi:prolyl oligopeptidase
MDTTDMRSVVQSLLLGGMICMTIAGQTPSDPVDKYQWLEDVWGEKSMAWVKAENEKSAKVLESDPRFAGLEAEALKVLESKDRLPMPSMRGNHIFNMWQDVEHVRGILRRTTVADYLTSTPHWQTVIDFDALGKQDGVSWVAKGLNCLYPGDDICLVSLSEGGEDAVTMREFSLKSGQFVAGGFVLPKSKQTVSWMDKDTLLVARDWGSGTMTKSGYPFVVKMWKRGEALEQAKEIFRGSESDVRASGMVLHDNLGHQVTILARGLDFFHSELAFLSTDGPRKISLPGQVSVEGLIDGRLIFGLNEDWTPEGNARKFVPGTVISVDVTAALKDPAHLKPSVVFEPTAVEFVQQVDTTKRYLLVRTLENVRGRAYAMEMGANGTWKKRKLAIPDNRAVRIVASSDVSDQFFLEVDGFLNPTSLWLGDAVAGTVKEVKTLPTQFDASKEVVEQLTAISKDGTKVPYFVVRRKDIQLDGSHPTLLTAYGGFQISRTPAYSAALGKLWLERGGIYVLANIRGGGEFGPAWHQAGLKTNRQRIYDDFAAVARDLVTRKITSPRRLGIEGGSNGGLLMGVEMTQHPEMWRAIIIQVPLLDMLRIESIAAGASWVGEYGSSQVPEERAFLASISPYHQLKADVTYPEPLIFTTTKDDRVGPVHARKFAAKMAEFGKPYFYKEITEGGHGAGADLKQSANTEATEYIYLMRKLMD